MERQEKTIECKVLQSTYPVTKGYALRRAKAFDTEAFGVDKTADEIRNNIGLTIVQRDNIWHPYYEVKLEEEDLGSKYRKNLEQKKQLAAVDGQAIEEIQQKLLQIDQAERDEKTKAEQKDMPQKAPKRIFDMKALMEKKKAEDEIES